MRLNVGASHHLNFDDAGESVSLHERSFLGVLVVLGKMCSLVKINALINEI